MKGLNKNNEQQQKITISSAKNMYIIQKGTIEANCHKKKTNLKNNHIKGSLGYLCWGVGTDGCGRDGGSHGHGAWNPRPSHF